MSAHNDYSSTPPSTKLGAKPGVEAGPLDSDTVQRIGLDAGLVDDKSAAIDGDWQAVRFVYRREDRRR